jgi:hypothetical protein
MGFNITSNLLSFKKRLNKRIPDFTLQETYYHLIQWVVDMSPSQSEKNAPDVLLSCCFQTELTAANGENS